MPTCSQGFTVDQINIQMLNEDALEYDKFTSPEVISTVRDFLSNYQVPELDATTDLVILYTSSFISHLAVFVKGCSLGIYNLDFLTSAALINLIGNNI